MDNAAKYPNSWSPYVLAKYGEVGSTHSWEQFGESSHPLKLHGENVLNRQYLSRGILDFADIL